MKRVILGALALCLIGFGAQASTVRYELFSSGLGVSGQQVLFSQARIEIDYSKVPFDLRNAELNLSLSKGEIGVDVTILPFDLRPTTPTLSGILVEKDSTVLLQEGTIGFQMGAIEAPEWLTDFSLEYRGLLSFAFDDAGAVKDYSFEQVEDISFFKIVGNPTGLYWEQFFPSSPDRRGDMVLVQTGSVPPFDANGVSPVPIPASLSLMFLGLGGLAIASRKARSL